MKVDQSMENSSVVTHLATEQQDTVLGTLIPHSLLWLFEDVEEIRACAGLLPLHQPVPLLLEWAVRTPLGCMAKLHGSSRWEVLLFVFLSLTGEEGSRLDYFF